MFKDKILKFFSYCLGVLCIMFQVSFFAVAAGLPARKLSVDIQNRWLSALWQTDKTSRIELVRAKFRIDLTRNATSSNETAKAPLLNIEDTVVMRNPYSKAIILDLGIAVIGDPYIPKGLIPGSRYKVKEPFFVFTVPGEKLYFIYSKKPDILAWHPVSYSYTFAMLRQSARSIIDTEIQKDSIWKDFAAQVTGSAKKSADLVAYLRQTKKMSEQEASLMVLYSALDWKNIAFIPPDRSRLIKDKGQETQSLLNRNLGIFAIFGEQLGTSYLVYLAGLLNKNFQTDVKTYFNKWIGEWTDLAVIPEAPNSSTVAGKAKMWSGKRISKCRQRKIRLLSQSSVDSTFATDKGETVAV